MRKKKATLSIPDFLRLTVRLCFSEWKVLLVSSFSFALIAGVAGTFPEQAMQQQEDELAQSMGISWEALRENVQKDLESLAIGPAESIIAEMEALPLWAPASASEHISLVYFLNVGPYVLMMTGILLLTLFLSSAYYFTFFGIPGTLPVQALLRLPVTAVSFLTLLVLVIIFSGLWIPFAGILIALYTLPRLARSPAIIVHDRVNAFTAVRRSFGGTRKQWAHMTVRLLALGLLAIPILWALSIPVSIAALFVPKLGSLLWATALALLTAYMAAGMTILARS